MKIIVDADACPQVIKNTLFKASQRLSIPLLLIANQPMFVPRTSCIKFILVEKGFDVADKRIVQEAEPNDLIITADIPLAAKIIEKGAFALNPRGEFYTKENISQKLAIRNLMSDLRNQGEISGGPAPINKSHQQDFANALDRFLNKK